jgi:hypothetical protein
MEESEESCAGQSVSPRNRRLYEQGRALRAEIRDMLLRHPPLAPPLTAKRIRERLTRNPAPSIRVIQWHCARIRAEAADDIVTSVTAGKEITQVLRDLDK